MVTVEITAGETLRFVVTSSFRDFTATTTTAYLAGPAPVAITGVISGSQAVFSADSSAYAPGRYALEIWGRDGNTNRVLEKGFVDVASSLATATGATDIRTDNEKALASINAMLSGTATQGVKSYTINNRTLDRYSIGELLQLQKHYTALVTRERRIARGITTLGPSIAVRI